jgi:hypothetical protein
VDRHTGRSIPLRESRNITPEGGVVDLINEDTEEGGGFVTRVWLKLRVDLYDERGGDSREQTSLSMSNQHALVKTSRGTHEDESRVQIPRVFLEEVLVVLFSHFAVFIVELSLMILLN